MATEYSTQMGASAYILKKLTYEDLEGAAQQLLWTLIRYNSTLKVITKNVLKREPEEIFKGSGVPTLIIPTPKATPGFATLRKQDLDLEFRCRMHNFSSDEQTKIIGVLRTILKDKIDTFASYGMHMPSMETDEGAEEIDNMFITLPRVLFIRFTTHERYLDG